jgi:serine/threonine-protein kinase
MATVYSAVDEESGQEVAVKVMDLRFAESSMDDTSAAIERFEREARIAATIDSPHVSRVLASGVDEWAGPYIVMELLAGEDVGHLVSRLGPLPPELALRIVGQACRGLEQAHAKGVVHRDVKPSNLFLAETPDGPMVKLLDFGIAKGRLREEPDGSKTLTRTGAVLGSPQYMSPEQAVGAKTVDHLTDIWSLGVVLFKLLSGRTPCDEKDPVGQLIVNIVNHPPPPVQDYAPWVGPEVAQVVARALTQAPKNRYASAREMLDAVTERVPGGSLDITHEMLVPMPEADRGDVKPRMPAPILSATVPGVSTDPDTTSATSPLLSSRRGGRRSSFAVVVAGVVAVLGVSWAVARRSPPEPPRRADAPPSVPVVAVAAAAAPPATGTAGSAPALASAPRQTQVRVSPATAAVEIDGVAVAVVGGKVDLTGDLGSVHRIHLRLGAQETTTEVTIAEDGARPSALALSAGHAPSAPPKPVAAVPPPAAPPPSANKPAPKFDTTFE